MDGNDQSPVKFSGVGLSTKHLLRKVLGQFACEPWCLLRRIISNPGCILQKAELMLDWFWKPFQKGKSLPKGL